MQSVLQPQPAVTAPQSRAAKQRVALTQIHSTNNPDQQQCAAREPRKCILGVKCVQVGTGSVSWPLFLIYLGFNMVQKRSIALRPPQGPGPQWVALSRGDKGTHPAGIHGAQPCVISSPPAAAVGLSVPGCAGAALWTSAPRGFQPSVPLCSPACSASELQGNTRLSRLLPEHPFLAGCPASPPLTRGAREITVGWFQMRYGNPPGRNAASGWLRPDPGARGRCVPAACSAPGAAVPARSRGIELLSPAPRLWPRRALGTAAVDR